MSIALDNRSSAWTEIRNRITVLNNNTALQRSIVQVELVLRAPLAEPFRAHVLDRGSLSSLRNECSLLMVRRQVVARLLSLVCDEL